MSSPTQAYAKRQQVKTIRRCDGTDDFHPITGITALTKRDTEAMAAAAAGRGVPMGRSCPAIACARTG